MGFRRLITRGASTQFADNDTITVSLGRHTSGRNQESASTRIRITFPVKIMNAMGWDPDTRLEIFFGEKEDHGLLLVAPEPDGYRLTSPDKAAKNPRYAIQKTLSDIKGFTLLCDHFKATPCEYKSADGCIYLSPRNFSYSWSPRATGNK